MLSTKMLKPLYDVKLINHNRQHFYQIGENDTWLPGVTTVLSAAIPKPALLPWSLKVMGENIREYLTNRENKPFTIEEIEQLIKEGKNIYKKKASDAADIGTRAHKAIDDIIKGVPPVIDEDIRTCVDAFQAWYKESALTIDLGDSKIGSKLFGYGGSLDMLAFRGNDAILIDLKTSKGIYPEMGFQICAYMQAFKETFGVEVKEAMILRVGKEKPDFEVKKLANFNETFQGFLAALKLYNLSKFEMFDDFKKI